MLFAHLVPWLVLLCATAGLTLPVQAALNNRLASHMGGARAAGAAV